MKRIVILGASGSIGKQAIDVCNKLNYEICAISAYSSVNTLIDIAKANSIKNLIVFNSESFNMIKNNYGKSYSVYYGNNGLKELLSEIHPDIVLNAIVGFAGLIPSLITLELGIDLALANKESLVSGGELVKKELSNKHKRILPVDSEHSAIFQCLTNSKINRLILTASGGPFYGFSRSQLLKVGVDDALNHPTWSMGKKITIDSATMMNKGFELIEACYLFDVSPDQVDILIHRQSIVHSMIEFCDNSIVAQLAVSDMRLPIEYALSFPERNIPIVNHLDLSSVKELTFSKPDNITFPSIEICREALKMGGIIPAVINAANEELVKLFLNKQISFLGILSGVEKMMTVFSNQSELNIETIVEADKEAREYVLKTWG